jgi:hypothetical protein
VRELDAERSSAQRAAERSDAAAASAATAAGRMRELARSMAAELHDSAEALLRSVACGGIGVHGGGIHVIGGFPTQAIPT